MSHYAMSNSVEWYTPLPYLEAVRRTLIEIDLDPASCAEANKRVRANNYFSLEEDGYSRPWTATTVFLNPPYGRTEDGRSSQAAWSQRFLHEYEQGRFKAGILLVTAAIGDQWFVPLWDHPVCLVYRRIRFDAPGGQRGPSPTKGNAFVYAGPCPAQFVAEFGLYGKMVL